MLARRGTIRYEGMEGKFVSKDSFSGKAIGIFTSGGDSQGMNSAVRAVVRMGIYVGAKVYLIKEGYQGMVDGEENIDEASWASVSGIMQKGGTVIGSARCMDFRERWGRLKAAHNLVKKGISNLVAIGGDGSLTGANLFKTEWESLLKELLNEGKITQEEFYSHNYLNIIGLVGSIDNDFCGTDMTIGTDSALHRIIEATDAITVTAQSHQRCFIMEVMGRHCGYLALVAALASEADWVFIPEMPPQDNWKEHLCKRLSQNRSSGQRINIIVIAEGAIDNECKPISAEFVKNLIVEKLKLDTRITVLGHVQRGGHPSAFDRNLGLRMGAEAVLALMDADKDHSLPACVVSIEGNQTIRLPLMNCVEKTKAVTKAMEEKNFDEAVNLRGKSFKNNLDTYMKLSKINPPEKMVSLETRVNIGLINIGAPACGVNAAMRSFTRLGITSGYRILGIHEGFHGLVRNQVKEIQWSDVRGWSARGGSVLGTRREHPYDVGIEKVAKVFAKNKFSALLLIGGFECFECMIQLLKSRDKHPEFCIPMIMLPSTISNNIPGTDFSLGCDTALNEITSIIDKIKQSAMGTKRRVFVVETMGGNCGYLATLSGLAGGADAAYIFEEKYTIDDLRKDVEHMRAKIADNVQRGLVLRCENANANYTSQFIHQLYLEEGKGVFDCRLNVLGHMQQGGVPTPFDRNYGTKLGAKAITWIDEILTQKLPCNKADTIVLMGLCQRGTTITPIEELVHETDMKTRLPLSQWWMNLRPLLRIMSKHESLYESDSIFVKPNVDEKKDLNEISSEILN